VCSVAQEGLPYNLKSIIVSITDALDEEIFAEVLGIFFPAISVATKALKVRAAAQLNALALCIRERTMDETLRGKTKSLLDWSQRLMSDTDAERSRSTRR
jgi:hypothetical protein